jgi:group I intron endonuclease
MYVYLIKNNKNNKWYVGKHVCDIGNASYHRYYGSGKLITMAVDKHGKENFTKYVIDIAFDKVDLANKELFWINFYMDNCGKNLSYNLKTKYYIGREKGHKQSKIHINKRVRARKLNNNYNWTDDRKKDFSNYKKGKPPPNKGKKCPEISISKMGFKNPMARIVFDKRDGTFYETIRQASDVLKIPYKTLASQLTRNSNNSILQYA